MLIRGVKWDMRIYVLVSQMRPMKLHLYKEGIVRFSADRYDCSRLNNQFSHLTNSSINKNSQRVTTSSSYGSGLKWSYDQLHNQFRSQGTSWEVMWVKIEQIIILTLINYCAVVPNLKTCFELLGFDILIDQSGKPWLLEVNMSPALSVDCKIDEMVKPQLIKDTVTLCCTIPVQEQLMPKVTTPFMTKRSVPR